MKLKKDEISKEIIEKLGNSLDPKISSFDLVGSAASGRQYYRIPTKTGSKVLMKTSEVDDDFKRFIQIQKFLQKFEIRVPKIELIDESSESILLEDLGDKNLLTVIEGLDVVGRQKAYSEVVESLARGHLSVVRKTQAEPLLHERHFDYQDLKWESQYFTKWCLEKKFPETDWADVGIQRAFDALAIEVQDHPWDLMHRDFQSQNVMLKDGEWVWIDFQGARIGSTWYDLASLLWDPYVCLPLDEVKMHFEAYSEHRNFTGMTQWDNFLNASLQRIMQACGAYGYLTEVKGLEEYEQYKEKGWQQLQLILELCSDRVRVKKYLKGL
mgnify:CR=1 FL=1